jgi:hypothetical protein
VRSDRLLAVWILISIAVLATMSIWVMDHEVTAVAAHILPSAPRYAIGPEDGVLVALTLGVIVACTYTVWPIFVFAHLWLVARRKLPWRLRLFATDLQKSRIIIRDGDVYRFRYSGLRTYLGSTLYDQVHEQRAAGVGSPSESHRSDHRDGGW